MTLRILRSLVLPITVAGVVPALIGWGRPIDPVAWRLTLGGALALVGLGLLGWTIALFGRVGRGTLAPWDPPKHLVVVGPYRLVRNPMISGVVTLVAGEALLTGSAGIAGWAAFVFALNHVWFQVYEEPGLRERFGAEFDEYCRHVPRWIPRLTPWSPL